MHDKPTHALVLETNNLAGADAGTTAIVRSLNRLLRHLKTQTFGLARLTQLVVTHDGPLAEHREELEAAAGRVLELVCLPSYADYYEAKNVGFDRTTADLVVFADADCWPEPTWLEALYGVFDEAPETQVAAGRTTYRSGTLGAAATTIDFMYFTDPAGQFTRNFYANNVAFRRAVFEARPFPLGADLYKGNCQLLGAQLHEAQIPIRFVPAARTVHRLPDRFGELLELRLLRGRDLRRVAPRLVASHGPSWFETSKSIAVPAVWLSRLGFSLWSFGRQDMPKLGRLGAAAAPAVMFGLSALDALGALGAGDRVWRTKQVLGYHGNRDGLEEGALHFGT